MVMLHVPVTGTGTELIVKVCYRIDLELTRIYFIDLVMKLLNIIFYSAQNVLLQEIS